MWILIGIFALVLGIGHAVYFGRRMTRALVDWIGLSPATLRRVRRLHLAISVSLPAALALFALYTWIARPESSNWPSGKLFDWVVVYPFWFVTIWSFQCSLLIAPMDLLHLLLRLARVGRGTQWRRRRNLAALSIAGFFLVVMPIGFQRAGRALEVREHTVRPASLPAGLDGYRIALIADVQADSYTDRARVAELVERVNQLRPDLVVIAGDLITRGDGHVQVAAEEIGRLRARDGVIAAIGDHDNWVYRGDRARSVRAVTEALAKHGVRMLDNRVERIRVGKAELALIVATNNYVNRIRSETARELLASARSADVRVVLAHQTSGRLLDDARSSGADLFLAGHTHGGQVRLWTPFGDVYPIRAETRYVSGAYALGPMTLIVTNGLGMSVAPFRYRAPPTIDVIEFAHR